MAGRTREKLHVVNGGRNTIQKQLLLDDYSGIVLVAGVCMDMDGIGMQHMEVIHCKKANYLFASSLRVLGCSLASVQRFEGLGAPCRIIASCSSATVNSRCKFGAWTVILLPISHYVLRMTSS
jgi:hypothetical protein